MKQVRRRRLSFILTAVLTLSVLGLFGPSPAFGAYTYPCGTANNEHEYIQVQASDIKGGSAEVWVEDVATCGGAGGSLVLPVNIEAPDSGTMCAAQLGYGRIGNSGRVWVYTPDDTNCYVTAVTGWPTPQLNHRYALLINRNSSECAGWYYELEDISAGTVYKKCGSRSVASGTRMWTGVEVYDNGDQMGGQTSTNDVVINYVMYRFGSVWYYNNSTTVHKNVGGTAKSYWVTYAQSSGGQGAIVRSHTNSH